MVDWSMFQSWQTKPSYKYRVTRHYYSKQQEDDADQAEATRTARKLRFEQSLDVYQPIIPFSDESTKKRQTVDGDNDDANDDDENGNGNENENVLFVLVMGSGWMGHVPWFYAITNWWNSPGPQTICGKLGYPCICIRHSGGYPSFFLRHNTTGQRKMTYQDLFQSTADSLSPSTTKNSTPRTAKTPSGGSPIIWLAASILSIVIFGLIYPDHAWKIEKEGYTLPAVLTLFVWFVVFDWPGQNAAQLPDMVEDVIDALDYVQHSLPVESWQPIKSTEGSTKSPTAPIPVSTASSSSSSVSDPRNKPITPSSSILSNSSAVTATTSSTSTLAGERGIEKLEGDETKTIRIVLGGYSSGGHVLATLLSKHPELYISSSPLPSSSSTNSNRDDDDNNKNNDDDDDTNTTIKKYNTQVVGVLYLSGVLSVHDCTFMNLVTLFVFGKWASQIPSPLYQLPSSSSSSSSSSTLLLQVRHLLVGCQYEVFGLPILNRAFASERFADKLNELQRQQQQEQQQQDSIGSHDNESNSDVAKCVLLQDYICNHWNILSSSSLANALEHQLPWLLARDPKNFQKK